MNSVQVKFNKFINKFNKPESKIQRMIISSSQIKILVKRARIFLKVWVVLLNQTTKAKTLRKQANQLNSKIVELLLTKVTQIKINKIKIHLKSQKINNQCKISKILSTLLICHHHHHLFHKTIKRNVIIKISKTKTTLYKIKTLNKPKSPLKKTTKLTQIKLCPLKTKVLLANKTHTKDNNKTIKILNAVIKTELVQPRGKME